MMNQKRVSLVAMALLYLAAGLSHFLRPEMYVRMVPPALPWPRPVVYVSGLAELLLGGLLLVPGLRRLAAWGVIALLIAVYPANIYQLTSGGAGLRVPRWALWLRLPMQFVLLYWAYGHTRPGDAD